VRNSRFEIFQNEKLISQSKNVVGGEQGKARLTKPRLQANAQSGHRINTK
jgi:hypothetical protein